LLLLYYTYWLRPDLLLCRNTYSEGAEIKGAASVEDAWEKLTAAGLSLLVVDLTSHAADFKRLWNERPDWVVATELYRGSQVAAYRVTSRDDAPRSKSSCKPGVLKGWHVRDVVAGKRT
jgi:hypothetical protein